MSGGFEEAVGLGVTIALTDLFSEAAETIISKFESLEKTAGHSAHAVREAVEGMKFGLGLLGAGSALLAPLVLLGEKAAEASEKAERLKIAYESLAPDGEALLERVRGVAAELRIFPTGQVLEAGKYMRAMGVDSERIPGLLRAAGIAATVMDESLETVAGRLQMLSVYAEQGMLPRRMLTQLGVSTGDLAVEGVRMAKGRLLSSSDELMAAVGRVIEKRMGEAAGKLRQGDIGIAADIQRQYGAFYKRAGDILQPIEERIKEGFLDVLKQLNLGGIGDAFGRGLGDVYAVLAPIGNVLREIVGRITAWVGQHPGIVRFATAVVGLMGVLLTTAGAVVLVSSAVGFATTSFKLLGMMAIGQLQAVWASLLPLLPTILPVIAVAGLLYAAWTTNFGGLRALLTDWWENLNDIVEGVVALFTSDGKGVGSIPAALHDKLVQRGLWGVTKAIFLWGERVIELFSGVWEGITAGFSVLAVVFRTLLAPIDLLIRGFTWLTRQLWPTNEAMDGVNGVSQESLEVMRTIGNVLGVVIAGFATYRVGLIAVRTATLAWQAAQWAINFALSANPIGIIIILVGLLIAGIAAAIAYMDELRETFEEMLDISPMRWLMKEAGIIPAGATDADIDEAMGSRKREYEAKNRRRKELGRDDFVSRLQDNLGLPGAVDLEAPAGMSPEEASSRNPAGYLGQLNAGLAASALRAPPHRPADQHIHVYLDGQQVHQAVVRHEESLANRHGD